MSPPHFATKLLLIFFLKKQILLVCIYIGGSKLDGKTYQKQKQTKKNQSKNQNKTLFCQHRKVFRQKKNETMSANKVALALIMQF